MGKADKARRALILFPIVLLCLIAGFWLANLIWPQGMSFGEPLEERMRAPFRFSAYPPDVMVINAMIAGSLLLADLVTPNMARALVFCFAALFAGGLYYELFYGNFIDTLLADWPTPIGDAASLSTLLGPHVAIVAAKLTVRGLRVPQHTLRTSQEAR